MKFFISVDYLLNSNEKGRTLIFDLDNTLYDESTFLFNAYNSIANLYKYEKNEVYEFLVSEFISKGRTNLFDKLVTKFPSEYIDVKTCLHVIRNYKCKGCLSVYPWVNDFLQRINSNFMLKIITNGYVQQQKNKFRSLNLPIDKSKVEVVFAKDIAEKPSKESFFALKNSHEFNNPIYVGDSDIDRKFCESLAIEFYDASQLI